jgi:DNA-binding NarL/FixJ family response regulator
VDEAAGREELTPREREVVVLMCRGLTNKEIARALGIRVGTVKSHVDSIFWKLGARSRTQAAMAAVRRGYCEVH